MRVVRVAEQGGDYRSPQAALAAITDASASNRYRVEIEPLIGPSGAQMGWPCIELATKDYVDLAGVGAQRVWLKGYQAPTSSVGVWGDVSVNSTVRVEAESTLSNLWVTIQNGRYAAHIDGPTMAGKVIRFENVRLDHFGNEEARSQNAVYGAEVDTYGSAHYVWQSMCAAGIGMWASTSLSFRDCYLRSPKGATLFCHTHNGSVPSGALLEVEDSIVESLSGETALMLQSFSSGQTNVCRVARSRIIGGASATVQTGTEQEWVVIHDSNPGLSEVVGAGSRQLWAAR